MSIDNGLDLGTIMTGLPPESIRAMPDVLTWQECGGACEVIHDSWIAVASESLGAALGALSRREPAKAATLLDGIQVLPNEAFERVLLAPETTMRLLYGGPGALDGTAEFILDAVAAEGARVGVTPPLSRELWTALGDAHIAKDGVVREGPRVWGLMPIDFDSPYSRDIDLTGAEYRVPAPRPPMTPTAQLRTLGRFERFRDMLASVNPLLLEFVRRFTKVLILQEDSAQPFSSGSNGQYVGR